MTDISISARRLLVTALLALAFGLSYPQAPLYTSNQNTYFLHGLAGSGRGFLDQDWLAQTTDPTPLFSLVVEATDRCLHENVFYVYYLFLLGIYIHVLVAIVSTVDTMKQHDSKPIVFFALATAIHAPFVPDLFHWGLAGQFLLGPVFQPSVFGVFVLASIALFLRNRHVLSVVSLGVAAAFHPTYLLHAALLATIYTLVVVGTRRCLRSGVRVALVSLLMLLPVAAYLWRAFGPTSTETLMRAQQLLVTTRLPHHASWAVWFNRGAMLQIALIIAAILMYRKSRLLPILLFLFIAALILSLVQVLSSNPSLALLFPWRASVFLVPLASCLIIWRILTGFFRIFDPQIERYGNWIKGAAVVALVGMVVIGLSETKHRFAERQQRPTGPLMHYVSQIKQPHHRYLIPSGLQRFRLETGARTFVDFKSHPFKDMEILEWYRRVRQADRYYRARGEASCRHLAALALRYGITHVVIGADSSKHSCSLLSEIYNDRMFGVYEVRPSDTGANVTESVRSAGTEQG